MSSSMYDGGLERELHGEGGDVCAASESAMYECESVRTLHDILARERKSVDSKY